MTSKSNTVHDSPSARRLIGRFGHLLYAMGIEGILSAFFFIYLAWLDATFYGEVMYAIAAGSIVQVGMRFGLYYPIVAELGKGNNTSEIINRANIIRLGLFAPVMLAGWALAAYRGLSPQMTWIIIFISLGFAFDSMAESFFADLRVRGRQDKEARIKMAGTLLGYGYGFLSAYLGLDAIMISLFMLISGLTRFSWAVSAYVRTHQANPFVRPDWGAVFSFFKLAIVFAMIENLGNLYNKTNIFFLESVVGVEGVASYSATWNVVDPVAKLASEQFLGWVIFPVLSIIWWKDRERVGSLVRTNALWLLAIAFPVMFVLHAESDFLIGLIYPDQLRDAVSMQKVLVWTIPFTFEGNLFSYVMMTAGAARRLLFFAVITAILNILYNIVLVHRLGLTGGCLVIVLTKLTMTILTLCYCQMRFRFFRLGDLAFPLCVAGMCFVLFLLLTAMIPHQLSVLVSLLFYGFILWRFGRSFLGDLTDRGGQSRKH
jgi:O-antigen/teichoic acid export membrane protein